MSKKLKKKTHQNRFYKKTTKPLLYKLDPLMENMAKYSVNNMINILCIFDRKHKNAIIENDRKLNMTEERKIPLLSWC